ncbi:hypothetical protein SEVIR_1G014600v4 [Setaria viridis]|uniref:Uncharacterized protein n=2 Tax=Setaria TaxID=4554 RepID=K3YWM4_SETIT|nr:uncharacterized protein LOC101772315 [Setaria italica]XP_034581255.1 uncharacterized protein LOC117844630 [Setaria viridis]RCV04616.1 hypothetical protein SETIT_1G014700v2 [Setaria italica]TKW36937.1 hypothetical protein SEVIR_1G014600v2 [Setaria viridis]
MGNCIQQSSSSSGSRGAFAGEGRRPAAHQLQRSGGGRRRSASGDDEEEGQEGAAPPPPVVKMKMVLTKGELGWLVARLNAGDRRLEDVLHEMAACKREGRAGAADGWRPSLESIVECPAETATEAAAAANSADD